MRMEPSTDAFLTGRVQNRKQLNVLKMSERGYGKCPLSTQSDIVGALKMRATKKTIACEEFVIGHETRIVGGSHAGL